MTTMSKEWAEVYEAYRDLQRHKVIEPAISRMTKLADAMWADPRFARAFPRVSHAFISFLQEPNAVEPCVYVGWTDEGYEVGVMVHRTQGLSDVTLVGADVVATMDTVARYIAGLASAPKR